MPDFLQTVSATSPKSLVSDSSCRYFQYVYFKPQDFQKKSNSNVDALPLEIHDYNIFTKTTETCFLNRQGRFFLCLLHERFHWVMV